METVTATAGRISATDMRDAFFTALLARARTDRRIVVLSLDFGAPSLDRFRADLPAQFINVGISEQNAISTAAGLALTGKTVIVYSIASFITARSLEQIKLDLCAMRLPVTIVGVGAGYAYTHDGPTHNALEDMALLRGLAGLRGICPSDPEMARALVDALPGAGGPTYLRFDRGKWPVFYDPAQYDFARGLHVVRSGGDVALVASGVMVHRALEVSDALAQRGVSARVIDLFRFKPVEAADLGSALDAVPAVVTIEEHTLHGGIGSAVADAMADAGIVRPLKRYGIPDGQLYAYGDRDALHRERSLDAEQLTDGIAGWLATLRG